MPTEKKQTNSKPTQIDSVKHQDKRANIPTEELRDFMPEDDKTPKTILYSRDTSLDPQLVWQGKEAQDSEDLEVAAIPIYIQEKIHPHAIIEDLRTHHKAQEEKKQLNLFDDFNGIEFEELIDFYRHEVHWSNRMILGDSLLVMNSLAEKEGLKGKVQMIYLDPPYGIKFGSNWQVSTLKREVKDGKAEEVTRQPEQVKAFRDTWELGIHSYLSYLRDRLVVARELLTESGSIFVQIGDDNVHLVRCLMDEVFGSENFVTEIVFKKTGSQAGVFIPAINDYLCWYAKDKKVAKDKINTIFDNREKKDNKDFSPDPLTSEGETNNLTFTLNFQGAKFHPGRGAHWKTTFVNMQRLVKADRISSQKTQIRFKRYWNDFPVKHLSNFWDDSGGASNPMYVVQTSPKVIQRCILMTTDPGDLVLDPTCGSGTTAYVAEQWGRRWITIDTSRVAIALAKTRLMSAQFPYYLLADSKEGIIKDAEITGQVPPVNPITKEDIKKGFVYKRVPHITLWAIANNEEIDVIYDKWQQQLEPIREQLNKLLKTSWEEWEIPREPDSKWSSEVKTLLEKWWGLRIKRQKEIDNSISRNCENEILYDQPYEDKKRIRVTGPFTVESLSPHRVLSTEVEQPASEKEGTKQASEKFETTIIDNLKKAGVQNTKKEERLKFDNLEPYPGTWIQAEGEYNENEGDIKRVAVSIGPEYGTVGSEQIKEAAKEAVQGIGYDLLIICGFAFDPNVSEESKRYGKLQILITKMNPDLMLGEELLKKTGKGNLFMVFGEPDIVINQVDKGKIQVEIKGLDIYDPTTGEIRSSSTKDIACWFIDTDYNGESFFVRHAYFTGGNEPYQKLKRTLKSEINEEAWNELYSTTSRPFFPPKGNGKLGKIAVKVINHYGDEVLKVCEINHNK